MTMPTQNPTTLEATPVPELFSECTDTPNYLDMWGGGCAEYELPGNEAWCEGYGNTGEEGETPNENCCVCKVLVADNSEEATTEAEPPPELPTVQPSSKRSITNIPSVPQQTTMEPSNPPSLRPQTKDPSTSPSLPPQTNLPTSPPKLQLPTVQPSFVLLAAPSNQCFGADDGGYDPLTGTGGILYNAVRDYVEQDCANNNNCEVGQRYGWPMNSWCVGNVTDMSYLFYEIDTFNEDISGWDTSNVRDMYGMFANATSFNGDLSYGIPRALPTCRLC